MRQPSPGEAQRMLQADAVGGVQLLNLPHTCGGHTTEFFTIGAAAAG